MKTPTRLFLIALSIAIICQSCFKAPEAQFSYDPIVNPEAGENIKFKNESIDAKEYYWDFENDMTSEEESPSTIFYVPGTYNVSLLAESGRRVDSSIQSILIAPPTIVEFYLYKEGGSPIVSAEVKVYETQEDYYNHNSIRQVLTDSNGKATTNHLEAKPYYVSYSKQESMLVYEGIGSISGIQQNKINIFYKTASSKPLS